MIYVKNIVITNLGMLGSISSFCTFKINHAGSFTSTISGRSYIDGLVDHFDFVDMDVFLVHELDDMMVVLGYNDGGIMFYHFMIPKTYWIVNCYPLALIRKSFNWQGVVFENNHGKKVVDTRDDHQPKGMLIQWIIMSGSKETVSEGPWSGGSRSEGNMKDDESEDEDFFGDLENIVDDVDVDMKEFHIHVGEDVECVKKMTKEASGSGVDFTEGEDLEVIDQESFVSLIVGEDNNRGGY
ncbi:unnamed protein product [Lactuca saligna]|uniref:PB1-like domain-containing protein n=1 Tax=Lactuca saligna TaxID=75948 RepID=A0AA35YZ13_LACSI|nr:unnamed protein product [Lactuca saligna]